MLHIEFAPMEGITGFPFRNAFEKVFGGISAYYTPFLTVNQNKKFGSHDIRDVDPKVNQSVELIPQILTNKPDQLAWGAERLYEMGYAEVNLNLGCPSPTVTKRHKGAGFLADPEEVDQLLSETYRILEADHCSVYLSVKSRIGMQDKSRFDELLRVYESYPLHRLVLHPRLGSQGYEGTVDLDCFEEAMDSLKCPLIYNGDLRSIEDVKAIRQRFPEAAGIMIGRGFLYDPTLILKIRENEAGEGNPQEKTGLENGQKSAAEDIAGAENKVNAESKVNEENKVTNLRDRLKFFHLFHDTLLDEYSKANPYPDSCVPRMKELWGFWLENPDLVETYGRDTLRKMVKKIKKSRNLDDYQLAVEQFMIRL
ncbi:MAG: tRNA-dihydrouridine synthase family protein [Lachnospiraceae bacterium]|nr:tRNA-dihydrouridine synthase family protein [Lachnospiraceae bacterium]